jgi:prophage tail gpP-like protein
MYFEGVELFRGTILTSGTSDEGNYEVTAYDANYYLANNFETQAFRKMTATAIVKQLCSTYGIAMGDIRDTGYVIPKMFVKNKSLFEIFYKALTETKKHTGKQYFLSVRDGKLNLLPRMFMINQYKMAAGANLLSIKHTRDASNMSNQVKVVLSDDKGVSKTYTQRDDALVTQYGILQVIEELSDKKANMQQVAAAKLRDVAKVDDKLSITAFGIPDVYAGTGVYVEDPLTGVSASYFVEADSHTFNPETGLYSMSLDLSTTDNIPQYEIEKDEAK